MHLALGTICLQAEKWGGDRTPDWPLAALLPRIAAAGFTDLEAWGPHLRSLDDAAVADLAAALDRTGLEIPSLAADIPLRTGQPIEQFWDAAGRSLSLCSDLGVSMLRVMPGAVGSDEAGEDEWRYVPQVLAAFAREAAFRDVTVVAETHEKTLADTTASALRLIERVNELNFKLLFQSLGFRTDATLAQWDALRPHVAHVHLQNRDEAGRFTALADGTLDYRRLIAQMKADGYRGDLVVEFTAGCENRRREDYDLERVLANAAADRTFALACWNEAPAPGGGGGR